MGTSNPRALQLQVDPEANKALLHKVKAAKAVVVCS
jgi:hypothetical protein